MIDFKEFADGLAFYLDGKEVVFYSKLTDRVRYLEDVFKECSCIGCVEVPFGINSDIMEIIKLYKK